jgi:hypothetical protein
VNLDKIKQFNEQYEKRRRSLAACLLVFKESSDPDERIIISHWIEQHRSWLTANEDTYTKMKEFYDGYNRAKDRG